MHLKHDHMRACEIVGVNHRPGHGIQFLKDMGHSWSGHPALGFKPMQAELRSLERTTRYQWQRTLFMRPSALYIRALAPNRAYWPTQESFRGTSQPLSKRAKAKMASISLNLNPNRPKYKEATVGFPFSSAGPSNCSIPVCGPCATSVKQNLCSLCDCTLGVNDE